MGALPNPDHSVFDRDPCDGCDGTCGDVCPVLKAQREAYERIRPAAPAPVPGEGQDAREADDRRWKIDGWRDLSDRTEDPVVNIEGPEFTGTIEVVPASERDRLQADATRLADGLKARGIIPGRNPDGVNDDVEKALSLIDDYAGEIARLTDETAVERLRERIVSIGAAWQRGDDAEIGTAIGAALDLLAPALDETGETT